MWWSCGLHGAEAAERKCLGGSERMSIVSRDTGGKREVRSEWSQQMSTDPWENRPGAGPLKCWRHLGTGMERAGHHVGELGLPSTGGRELAQALGTFAQDWRVLGSHGLKIMSLKHEITKCLSWRGKWDSSCLVQWTEQKWFVQDHKANCRVRAQEVSQTYAMSHTPGNACISSLQEEL